MHFEGKGFWYWDGLGFSGLSTANTLRSDEPNENAPLKGNNDILFILL